MYLRTRAFSRGLTAWTGGAVAAVIHFGSGDRESRADAPHLDYGARRPNIAGNKNIHGTSTGERTVRGRSSE